MKYLILAFALLASCKNPLREFTAQNQTDINTVAVQEKFYIKLGECIGCEDAWKMLQGSDLINLLEQHTVSSCEDCDGGSGTEDFLFEAKSVGQAKMIFEYFGDTLEFHFEVIDSLNREN